MAISLTKDDLKFGNGITGTINVDLQAQDPAKPLDPSTAKLLKASFGAAGGTPFAFGPQGKVNLSIDAGVTLDLTPYWKDDSALETHGVSHFFDGNPDQYILAFDIAAHAKVAAAGSYRYGALTADASIEAGASGELWFCRPYSRQARLEDVIHDFFGNFCSPASLIAPPPLGESIYYEFDGYLKLAADISAGYEMKGTPDFSIGSMLLSEHYDFSILGKLGLGADIAGSYSVQVTAATDPKTGNALPDWARVVVNKKHSSQLSFAADVKIGLTADTQGLPGTASEFLGSLLGTNAKNWLNWAQKVLDNSDPDTLKKTLDGLSEQFIGKWTGKAFDELDQTDLGKLIDQAHSIATSYEQLDTTAINLFDKYFNLGETALKSRLQQLESLASLPDLATKYTNAALAPLIEELTAGDPLSWIAGQVSDGAGQLMADVLGEFNSRVNDSLALIQDSAHSLIKQWITLAKSQFGIDNFMQQLSTMTSWTDLKKLADDKLNGFVERIMGKAIDQMDRGLFAKVLGVLHNVDALETKLYKAFTDTLQQTATLNLHAEYSRSSETDALIDVELNLSTVKGRQLLQAAAVGDFSDVLRGYQPDSVRILSGKLHSALKKQSILTVNVAGWHHEFNYLSTTTLLTTIDQNIVPGDNGALTVFTQIDMSDDHVRKVNLQEMHSNFMLRVLGESHGTIVDPPEFGDDQKYFIDSVTHLSASYDLTLEDKAKTTQAGLKYLLNFASAFDLVQAGATVEGLVPYLETESDGAGGIDFGDVQVEYQVRYNEQAINRFFQIGVSSDVIRQTTRQIVFSTWWNSVSNPSNSDVAWVYWSASGKQAYDELGVNLRHISSLTFPLDPLPFGLVDPHSTKTLNNAQLNVLYSFFLYEDRLASALDTLFKLIRSTGKVSPQDYQKALGDIGTAFGEFDEIGTNVVFAIWDRLIANTQPPSEARVSSLKVTSIVGKSPQRVKILVSRPAIAQVGVATV